MWHRVEHGDKRRVEIEREAAGWSRRRRHQGMEAEGGSKGGRAV